MNEHSIVVAIVVVAGLGIAAQWLAWRLKVPSIVLLAAAGLLAGPGLGIVHPEEAFGAYLRPVVSLCVAIILFEGGLSLQLRDLKVAASGVRRLVYIGAARLGFLESYEHFHADRDEEDIEILVIDEEGDVDFREANRQREVAAGETILYFARDRKAHETEMPDAQGAAS